ncbi:NADPH-dependent 7-cyano-7-deazaguanine reductase QueF [Buchnera aphidicola (Mindarus keteleerifoliae)]|uniref:NADPH-dependent 7-cyano-7-deazaguanine reductase QueF n=1 Tax=Buchnera aphidicola TaxID=9 RepID=UPI0031B6AE95
MFLKMLKGISRENIRKKLTFDFKNISFIGFDIWNLYELSWLNKEKIPQLALGILEIDAKSINLIESKSFKLYLHSLNNSIFFSKEDFKEKVKMDLKKIVQGRLVFNLFNLSHKKFNRIRTLTGINIDNEKINLFHDIKNVLTIDQNKEIVEESLCSNLLRSNCPKTKQPDWASVEISYKGFPINKKSLLIYLINFRDINKFHEDCVEKIFSDINHFCKPIKLSVYARYNRRGGIDINPWRSNCINFSPSHKRLVRQ